MSTFATLAGAALSAIAPNAPTPLVEEGDDESPSMFTREQLTDLFAWIGSASVVDPRKIVGDFKGNRPLFQGADYQEFFAFDLSTEEGVRRALTDLFCWIGSASTVGPVKIIGDFKGNEDLFAGPDYKEFFGW